MLIRDDSQQFWKSMSSSLAMKFFDSWCEQANESGLEQMQNVAISLQHCRSLLANWLYPSGEISSGIADGLNGATTDYRESIRSKSDRSHQNRSISHTWQAT